jgi:hypothetical protein
MPLSTPTAAPVSVYHYGSPTETGGDGGSSLASALCGDAAPVRGGRRLWVAADYFYGAAQGSWVPPLVTASPAGTPPSQAGVPGFPSTFAQFGGRREGNTLRPGFRLEVGYWFDDARTRGFDVSYFFLGRRTDGYAATQPDPAGVQLYQPLVTGTTGVAVPVGLTPAGIAAHTTTDITGADVNYRRICLEADGCRVALLAGYRFLALDDEAEVKANRFVPTPLGPIAAISDSLFQTRNRFHGGQLGVSACEGFAGGFTVEVLAKCALGVTLAEANLAGSTSAFGTVTPASPLVGPTNAGHYTAQYFAVVPEADVRLGCRLTDCVRLNLGYSFLYWSKVQRAADQIDLNVPPAYTARTTDYWVQGWTLGVEVRY